MKERNSAPPHPGVILQAEMKQAGLGARDLADALKVPPSRISQILSGERNISADTASRLERFFGASAKCWLEDQNEYDLWCVNKTEIERDVSPLAGRKSPVDRTKPVHTKPVHMKL